LPSPDKLAQARVLVVGDAMLDRYWFGAVERISPEAPVPVVRVLREETRPGGAANAAVNVAALGARCTLLSTVGDDAPGQTLRGLLKRQGVVPALVADAATVVKLRVIGSHQQMVRVDFEGKPAAEALKALMIDFGRLLLDHDVVLLSDYGKGALTYVRDMIAIARTGGKPVLVDPKGANWDRYTGATVITPNRGELAQVVGECDSEEVLTQRAQALRRRLFLAGLLLTRAEEGMTMFDADGQLDLPTRAREVWDVTGAGDTVIATLAALMAAGMSLRDAAPYANQAAGIVVGKIGTAAATYADLE
jgi:rfaE bifunctional protein kinase chain/domain